MGKIRVETTKIEEISYFPCAKCGSEDIDFNSKPSSSNSDIAWGKCKKCGAEVKIEAFGSIPKEDIVSYWNKINDPQILIKKYHKEILRLQKMINDLPLFLKDEKLTLLNNNEFKEELLCVGFKSLGYGWYRNYLDDIRIRLWGNEIDVWEWKNNEDNQIRFRGKISSIEEVKWVLNRCFNIN